jgi:replication initiation protein RepC
LPDEGKSMETHVSTTPFGRRPATLGQIAAQLQVKRAVNDAGKPGSNAPAVVNKWQIFRTLTEIRDRLGVSDRSLGVLNALLSFHPETALTLPKLSAAGQGEAEGAEDDGAGTGQAGETAPASCDLVVFPSNRQLCQRAHGMAEKTLRNHLAMLVNAGLIIRRDSPNGKRYARKDASGHERFSDAFGFDLIPLVTRSAAFESMAEEARRERRAVSLLKERISLHRRDVSKLVALGLDEELPGDWEDYRQRFLMLLTPMRRIRNHDELRLLEAELAALRLEVNNTLESHVIAQEYTGNDGLHSRHYTNSKTQHRTEFEPAPKKQGAGDGGCPDTVDPVIEIETREYPLGMVMEACPDVNEYRFSGGKVRTWPDFLDTVRTIRPMLGISPSAWEEAIRVLGMVDAHIVLATILQRSEHSSEARMAPGDGAGPPVTSVNGSPAIKSAGGYLRALTEKAAAGEFALGPVLMALIGQRLKVRRAGA